MTLKRDHSSSNGKLNCFISVLLWLFYPLRAGEIHSEVRFIVFPRMKIFPASKVSLKKKVNNIERIEMCPGNVHSSKIPFK